MLQYFRKNQQVFISFIIVYSLGAVYFAKHNSGKDYLVEYPIKPPDFAKFFNLQFEFEKVQWLLPAITLIFLLFLGFFLVRISINYFIIQQRAQFPALYFIAISCFAFGQHLFSMVLPASVFLILSLTVMFNAMENKQLSLRFFDAGILLSLGSLFYINLIFLLPFLLLAQLTLRDGNRREILFILFGVSLPYIYLISAGYLANWPMGKIWGQLFKEIILKNEVHYNWIYSMGVLGYLVIVFIASIYAIQKISSAKIITRKVFQLFFYLFLNVILVLIIVPSAGIELVYVLAIPGSILLSFYFSQCRKFWLNGFLFLLSIIIPISLIIYR